MHSVYRWGLVSCAGILLTGCATWLHSPEGGEIEITKIKDAIECELVAVAKLPPTIRPLDIERWRVKSTLDMTLVASIGADGVVTYILRTIDPLRVVPSASVSGRETNVARVEFANPIGAALTRQPQCVPGPDPSGTGMGLAAWFESTLRAIPRGEFAGGTFTTEFELAGSAGGRFGYTFTRVFGDAGAAGRASHTHRLSVAFNTPTPPSLPLEVVIVGDTRPPRPPAPSGAQSLTVPGAPRPPRVRAVPRGEFVAPAVNDLRLNRQLDNARPITLEPR